MRQVPNAAPARRPGTRARGGSAAQAVRVLMLDDHRLSRRGLEIVLSAADGIEVVGGFDADTGDHLVIDLRPDVVVVGAGSVEGVEPSTFERVRAAVPQARILTLSRSGAATAGADGALARSWSVDEVADEIRRVARSADPHGPTAH